jgi:hypothetical protein
LFLRRPSGGADVPLLQGVLMNWQTVALAAGLTALIVPLANWLSGRKRLNDCYWARYERLGDDPIGMQWQHREIFMNERQAKLDASQNIMTRLL